MPDPAAPADDGNAGPLIVSTTATPGDDAVTLVPRTARTAGQQEGPRALRHHGLLLQAVQYVQVHGVGLGGRGEGQHQDHARSTTGMSPHHLPPPGLAAAESEVLLPVLHVEDGDVEEKFVVF